MLTLIYTQKALSYEEVRSHKRELIDLVYTPLAHFRVHIPLTYTCTNIQILAEQYVV